MKTFSFVPWVGLIAGLSSLPVYAQHTPWSLHAGFGTLRFSPSSQVEVAGRGVPGADIRVSDSHSLALEVGYDLTAQLTLRMAFGAPPSATLRTGGALNGLVPPLTGKLGEVKYMPLAPSITYRFGADGPIRPYVGAGVNHMRVLSTSDADVSNLRVQHATGPLLQAGLDMPLDPRWSLYVDARKVWLKATATGSLHALGGLPVRTEINLRPVTVFAGVGYRF